MYQRARKLEALMGDASAFAELAELQLEAYVVAMNALALVDPKSQWITLPIVTETGHEVGRLFSGMEVVVTELLRMHHLGPVQPRKRRKLSKYIPESKYALGKRDSEAVDLKDMQYEYALLSARVELVRRDPTLLSAGGAFSPLLANNRPFHGRVLAEFALPPASIVLRLAQANRFNTAMAIARSLDLDMSDIFSYLVGRCLRLSRNPEAVL